MAAMQSATSQTRWRRNSTARTQNVPPTHPRMHRNSISRSPPNARAPARRCARKRSSERQHEKCPPRDPADRGSHGARRQKRALLAPAGARVAPSQSLQRPTPGSCRSGQPRRAAPKNARHPHPQARWQRPPSAPSARFGAPAGRGGRGARRRKRGTERRRKTRAPPEPARPQGAPTRRAQRPTHGPRGPGQPRRAAPKARQRAAAENARPMPLPSPASSAHPGILPTGAAAARATKKRAPPAPAGPPGAPAQRPQCPIQGPRRPAHPRCAAPKTRQRATAENARPMPRPSPASSAHPGNLPTGAAAAPGAKKRAPRASAGPPAAPAQPPQRPIQGPRRPGRPRRAAQKTRAPRNRRPAGRASPALPARHPGPPLAGAAAARGAENAAPSGVAKRARPQNQHARRERPPSAPSAPFRAPAGRGSRGSRRRNRSTERGRRKRGPCTTPGPRAARTQGPC